MLLTRDLSTWSVLHHATLHGQVRVLAWLVARRPCLPRGDWLNLKV
jgi:hypothetical protein